MNRRQVARGADAVPLELSDHPLAVDALGQRDDVDEPRALVLGVVRAGSIDAFDAVEQALVPRSDSCARLEYSGKLLELADPDRRADVVDAVVEAEPRVLEPAAAVGATLVAKALEQAPLVLGVGRDDAALAGRDLLVRIEGEHRGGTVGANGRAAIAGAERFAGVLDERQPVPLGERAQRLELTRVAEDVDGDDRLRPRRDRRVDGCGVEVERARVDVCEDRCRPLVDRAVRARRERERRRDRLVPGLEPRDVAEQVQSGRAARDRRCVRRSDRLREELLEAVDPGAQREAPRPQHLEHELLLPPIEPRARERDLARARARARGHAWAG